MNLFDKGFERFKQTNVVGQGALAEITEKKYANHVYTKNSFAVPLTEQERKNVVLKVELDKSAKLKDGVKVGKTEIYVGNEKVGERNLFYSKRKLVATTGVYWNNVKKFFSYDRCWKRWLIRMGSDGSHRDCICRDKWNDGSNQ